MELSLAETGVKWFYHILYRHAALPSSPSLDWVPILVITHLCNHCICSRKPHVYEKNAYEVLIGGYPPPKQKYVIRKKVAGEPAKSKEVNYILDKNKFKPFWITWINGTIAVGKGTVFGVDTQVSWTDPSPLSITAISMDTVKSDLQWQFRRDAGMFKSCGAWFAYIKAVLA